MMEDEGSYIHNFPIRGPPPLLADNVTAASVYDEGSA